MRSRRPGSEPANRIGMTTAIVAPPGCLARLSAQPLFADRIPAPARAKPRRARRRAPPTPGAPGRSATRRRRAQLGQAHGDTLAPLGQPPLEVLERRAAVADERELAGGGARRRREQAPAPRPPRRPAVAA